MRPLTQVQNPKQARWFPVNSTIRAVSTLAARSFRLPVYKRPSYQSGLQIARFANSARSRFGDDALARGWRSNRPQMGCVSWARLSGLVSSDEAAVGEQCTPCDPSGAVGSPCAARCGGARPLTGAQGSEDQRPFINAALRRRPRLLGSSLSMTHPIQVIVVLPEAPGAASNKRVNRPHRRKMVSGRSTSRYPTPKCAEALDIARRETPVVGPRLSAS